MSTALPARTRAAFSMLEVVIAMALLSVVMVGTTQAMRTGTEVTEVTTEGATAAAAAGRIIHDIAEDLRSADRNFIYDTSDPDLVVFSFNRCTGFDSVTGAPEYGAAGSVVVTFERSSGTLTKSDGAFNAEIADNVTDFSVTQIGSGTGGTVYGNRIQLSLTITRNPGTDTEVAVTANRTVFLRSYLFNSDGLNAAAGNQNDGSSTTSSEEPTDYPADYPDEAIPADEATGDDPPSIAWGTNTGPSGEILLKITISPSKNSHTVPTDQVSINFPYHHNEAFTVTETYLNSSKATEVTIEGPLVGNTPITITASSIKNGVVQGSRTETNSF